MFWVVIWMYSIAVYGQFPSQIPTHIGFTGAPDAYGSKVGFCSIPFAATLILGLGFGITRFMYSSPEIIYMPNKAAF